jgi:hypothetical protein
MQPNSRSIFVLIFPLHFDGRITMPRGKQNKRGFQAGNTQNKKSSRVRRTCDRHLPAVSSAAEGKIHRVDPDFGSTFSVSNRGSQSNCWVNWKIMGQPCEFQVLAAAATRRVPSSSPRDLRHRHRNRHKGTGRGDRDEFGLLRRSKSQQKIPRCSIALAVGGNIIFTPPLLLCQITITYKEISYKVYNGA